MEATVRDSRVNALSGQLRNQTQSPFRTRTNLTRDVSWNEKLGQSRVFSIGSRRLGDLG